MTEEDGNETGESHAQGYESYRAIPLETNILDLVKLPRRSWRRGEYPIDSVPFHICLPLAARAVPDLISGKAIPHAEGGAVHSDAESEEWVSVHEGMETEGSCVDWDHCSVASL